MALKGNLHDFSITQLLNLIHLARKTGTLAIDGKTMKNATDEAGHQTHIMSVVGHDSKTCHTQKK